MRMSKSFVVMVFAGTDTYFFIRDFYPVQSDR